MNESQYREHIAAAVRLWLEPIKSKGIMNLDTQRLADHLTESAFRSNRETLFEGDEHPRNEWAIAAFVMSNALSLYAQGSDEANGLTIATGNLLKNLQAHAQTYLNPQLFPTNESDRALIRRATLTFDAAIEDLARSHPELLSGIRAIEGCLELIHSNNEPSPK